MRALLRVLLFCTLISFIEAGVFDGITGGSDKKKKKAKNVQYGRQDSGAQSRMTEKEFIEVEKDKTVK
eukprot:CAMPEP_0176379642 /NCGR_PEP_ID=MMETSP0126-20121128/30509_1 /TAXON_ID=141414 ORGANISM="Strombidinopsis acuminatum, Strain SPMC142" /NCGR_SAMPLE_ID=MMETSP0126 /ASSEMBLY_ACC=CAM_ASM_000229 /LENGTH=67 /DNA_ID=CAMNT_0017742517 /DNA_START=8 /DNA_END=211 /DNA_ORIENTATION=+